MKRASVLLIASIGHFRRRPPGASCAGTGCRLRLFRMTPTLWDRLARFSLCSRCAASILLMLCLCGCGARSAGPPVLNVPDCPAPAAPALPLLDAAEPLESPANMAAIMERDDRMRAYINGLSAALSCWQVKGGIRDGSN